MFENYSSLSALRFGNATNNRDICDNKIIGELPEPMVLLVFHAQFAAGLAA